MDMDFVGGYVGVSLKYSKYRDRIFRVLLLLFCVFRFCRDIYANRKTRSGFATVLSILPVVGTYLYSLRFIRAIP